MNSPEHFGGISEDEHKKLIEMVRSPEGQHVLAKRLGKTSEEPVTYDEAYTLYMHNPDPLFFAHEVKLESEEEQPRRAA
jgi:hypothetical protein